MKKGETVCLTAPYPMTFVGQVFDRPLTRTTSEGSWDGTEKVAIQIGEEVKLYTADENGGLTPMNLFIGKIKLRQLTYWLGILAMRRKFLFHFLYSKIRIWRMVIRIVIF